MKLLVVLMRVADDGNRFLTWASRDAYIDGVEVAMSPVTHSPPAYHQSRCESPCWRRRRCLRAPKMWMT